MAVLIVINGESNSGGYALSAGLPASFLLPQPKVQILNNTTFLFEPLHIGVNALIDHAGLSGETTHGWEAGLLARVNKFREPVYLVKTGQGGTQISEWGANSVYTNKFKARVSAAKSILTNAGIGYKPILWYTQGINDWIAGTDPTVWVNATKAHHARMRIELPGAPILFTDATPQWSAYTQYNQSVVADTVKSSFISAAGASLRDANHWDRLGMDLLASRLVDKTLAYIPQSRQKRLIPNLRLDLARRKSWQK